MLVFVEKIYFYNSILERNIFIVTLSCYQTFALLDVKNMMEILVFFLCSTHGER